MEFKELEKLYAFLFTDKFKVRINLNDQIKYDAAFEDLHNAINIKKQFFIDKESFRKVIFDIYGLGTKYLKIHFIQESINLGLNIGFSFANNEIEDGTIENDLDSFWIIRNDLFLKVNKSDFADYKKNFKINILNEIEKHTKIRNTQYITYNIDDVLRYIIRNLFSNTSNVTGILINNFIFKDYTDSKMNDRIGISVHTITKEESNQKYMASSIGYDFGTVYP